MRKVLIVSTQSAYRMVLEIIRSLRKDYSVEVIASDAAVAQLTSCEELASELRIRLGRCDYDLVLIPGLVKGSAKVIEEAIGCRVYKGSRYAGDIPILLELVEQGVELSSEVPADDIFRDIIFERLLTEQKSLWQSKKPMYNLGAVDVYQDPPPILLLLEATSTDLGAFEKKVLRAIEAGYEGVVIGSSGRPDLKLLERLADRVRELYSSGIVGIDVPRISQLSRDIVEKVDVVFNVTYRDVDRIASIVDSNRGLVVIPTTTDNLETSLKSVGEAISRLEEVGLRRVVVDPLIRPLGVGFSDSIVRFKFSKMGFTYPHLFGSANVYEVVDADSHGIVALIMGMALELGASIVLVTEESNKVYGAIEEHSIARYMAYSAYLRKSPPKDLPSGADLLLVKGKRASPPPPPVSVDVKHVGFVELVRDPNYYVRIYPDHQSEVLVVDIVDATNDEVLARYIGTHPLSLARAIVREFRLIPEHVAYLGYELSRAELSLKFRKDYGQDSEVVVSPRERARQLKDVLSYRKA